MLRQKEVLLAALAAAGTVAPGDVDAVAVLQYHGPAPLPFRPLPLARLEANLRVTPEEFFRGSPRWMRSSGASCPPVSCRTGSRRARGELV